METITVLLLLVGWIAVELMAFNLINFPGAGIRWLLFRKKAYNEYLVDNPSRNVLYAIILGLIILGLALIF